MTGAVILSAGVGRRMTGCEIPKQYLAVRGKPILIYTIEQFQRHKQIDAIWIVASPAWEETIFTWKNEYGLDKVQALALPGDSRQESVLNGLRSAGGVLSGDDGVIIQDAVRPLCSQALISRLIGGLSEAPCVMPALPVTDTVYLSEDGGQVSGLLDRTRLFAGQAPEAFLYQPYLDICEAEETEALAKIHGSSELPHRRGMKVKIIPGEAENIKITRPADLELFETILERREGDERARD